MGLQSIADRLHVEMAQRIANRRVRRHPPPAAAELGLQPRQMRPDVLMQLPVRLRSGRQPQDAEQQQVRQIVHPALGTAMVGNVIKTLF
ncbi:MAG: hypothetical protein U1F75_03290 [Plasticicumulans sp.]